MAIEVTTFNYPTVPNSNIDEVYDWLVANASEYFPGGIVKDTSANRINCRPLADDLATVFCIPLYNSNTNAQGYVKPKYGTVTPANPNANIYGGNAYRKAFKTSNGVALMAHGTGASVFITKTSLGHTCVMMEGTGSIKDNSGAMRFVLADMEGGNPLVSTQGSLATIVNVYRIFLEAEATVLSPIVFAGGDHTTNLLMTPFSQAGFSASLQVVNIDGQEYVYDGLFALKG